MLERELRALKEAKPRWYFFKKWFGSSDIKEYEEDIRATGKKIHGAMVASRELKHSIEQAMPKAIDRCAKDKKVAERALDAKISAWETKLTRLVICRDKYGDIHVPKSYSSLEEDSFQINGLWHTEALYEMRSQLFQAALSLHEAWIAEATRSAEDGGASGFGANIVAITKLIGGKQLVDDQYALPVWQSLFMVVPVISTTFASFANQFRGIGAQSIGWLFIDEAGQAVPQAAVGALWRAKRAVVVGDPLQIEPVFTVPIGLIKALSSLSVVTQDGQYSPHATSVQRLADLANPFGTVAPAGDEPRPWIGSPLRVHRRCVDPMFTIANRIAYGNKMVFGLRDRNPPADVPNIGRSVWFNIRGRVTNKQVVQEQVDFILQLIISMYVRDRSLPEAYIISPFKRVKTALRTRIRDLNMWKSATNCTGMLPTKKDLNNWCKDRIGTVHTFQGKEESAVIMVLGVDKDHAGSAAWASDSPNILNVAVTRAKHNFYMVGDIGVWGGLRYFSDALEFLEPVDDVQDFLRALAISA